MAGNLRLLKSLKPGATVPRCGLCGKTENLVRTECCGNWICNDEDKYVIFSYARNSCHRNHDQFTLCAGHHHLGHEGDWKTCKKCRTSFEAEMYVWYGTNEYNFEKLENPPSFKPTHCISCGVVIKLGEDGYTKSKDGYSCASCSHDEMQQFLSMRGSISAGKATKTVDGTVRGTHRKNTEGVILEEEYADVLRELETAIVRVHKHQPSLLDLEILDALEGLIRMYAWEKEGRGVPTSRLSDRPLQVFEACRKTCECWLGHQSFTAREIRLRENTDRESVTLDELLRCLKRIRSSVQLWNKEGGRQGYLNYVRQFLPPG